MSGALWALKRRRVDDLRRKIKAAIRAVKAGQSYSMGGRTLTRASLSDLEDGFFGNDDFAEKCSFMFWNGVSRKVRIIMKLGWRDERHVRLASFRKTEVGNPGLCTLVYQRRKYRVIDAELDATRRIWTCVLEPRK